MKKVQRRKKVNSDNGKKQASDRGEKEKIYKVKRHLKRDTYKLKRETPFLYFLAKNPHQWQTKKFLKTLLLPSQYKALREIAVNELAGNLPQLGTSKKKSQLKKASKARLTKLAKGQLLKSNLHHILDLIRILADHTLTYHDLC